MSTLPSNERTRVQFVFLCNHQISYNYRRRDGRPLEVSRLMGPNSPSVVREPIDPQADPQVCPAIRRISQVCRECTRRRIEENQRIRQHHYPDERAVWKSIFLELVHRRNRLEDIALKRALREHLRRAQERMERRSIGGNPPAENNHNNETEHGEQSQGQVE